MDLGSNNDQIKYGDGRTINSRLKKKQGHMAYDRMTIARETRGWIYDVITVRETGGWTYVAITIK